CSRKVSKEIAHRCMQICRNTKERERSVFDNCYVGNCRRTTPCNEPQDVDHDKLLDRCQEIAQHTSRAEMFINPLVKSEYVGKINGPVRASAKECVIAPHVSKSKINPLTFSGAWIARQMPHPRGRSTTLELPEDKPL